MPRLSVIVSDFLHQQIMEKGTQIGVDNISDAVRILLLSAIENSDFGSNEGMGKALRKHALKYSVMDHYLLEECVLALVEAGPEIRDTAYAKAEKFIATLSQETS